MRRKILLLMSVLLLLNAGIITAQTASIPDPGFKKYLQEQIPDLLDANGELLISKANTYPYALNFFNYNIISLEGIEHFTTTGSLVGYDNFVKSFPQLAALKNLNTLLFFNNKLDSLPDLPLKKLTYIQIRENNLSKIGSFDSLINLEVVNLAKNKIKVFPSLDNCKELKIFDIGENLVTVAPDVSKNLKLIEFLSYKNELTELPSFSLNRNLEKVHSDNNKIEKLQDFSKFTFLKHVNICSNNLTFEDLLPSTSHPRFDSVFIYSPQNNIGKAETFVLNENDNLEIQLGIDAGITTNTYKWFKNGKFLKKTPVNKLKISSVMQADSGIYTCEVTNSNPKLKLLTLKSESYKVKISKCISFSSPVFEVSEAQCNDPGKIKIKIDDISGGKGPYRYEIKGNSNQAFYTSTTGNFDFVIADNYTVTVRDAGNCQANLQSALNVNHNLSNCKGIIVTPNGDGRNDEYFFQETATLRIYSSNGQLVKKLHAPAYWDGKNDQGLIAPGYYIIKNEKDEIFHITVIN